MLMGNNISVTSLRFMNDDSLTTPVNGNRSPKTLNNSRLAKILSQPPAPASPGSHSLFHQQFLGNGSHGSHSHHNGSSTAGGGSSRTTPSPSVSFSPIVNTNMLSGLIPVVVPPSNNTSRSPSVADFNLNGFHHSSPINLISSENNNDLQHHFLGGIGSGNGTGASNPSKKRKGSSLSKTNGNSSNNNGTTSASSMQGDEQGQYACNQCEKSFNKQSSLARHKYEHSG